MDDNLGQAAALLARLDERTVAIQNDVASFRQDLRIMNEAHAERTREVEEKAKTDKQEILLQMETTISDIKKQLDGNYVTKDQFTPIQKLVYGFVSVIVMGVLGAIITTVLSVHPTINFPGSH
jgi:hypothetical protein